MSRLSDYNKLKSKCDFDELRYLFQIILKMNLPIQFINMSGSIYFRLVKTRGKPNKNDLAIYYCTSIFLAGKILSKPIAIKSIIEHVKKYICSKKAAQKQYKKPDNNSYYGKKMKTVNSIAQKTHDSSDNSKCLNDEDAFGNDKIEQTEYLHSQSKKDFVESTMPIVVAAELKPEKDNFNSTLNTTDKYKNNEENNGYTESTECVVERKKSCNATEVFYSNHHNLNLLFKFYTELSLDKNKTDCSRFLKTPINFHSSIITEIDLCVFDDLKKTIEDILSMEAFLCILTKFEVDYVDIYDVLDHLLNNEPGFQSIFKQTRGFIQDAAFLPLSQFFSERSIAKGCILLTSTICNSKFFFHDCKNAVFVANEILDLYFLNCK